MWGISQKALHRTTLDLHEGRIHRGSLFPFFDDEGVVRRIMVVTPDSGKIALIVPEELRRKVSQLRAKQIEGTWSGLQGADRSAAEGVASLWHFDPWWVLGEDRFHGHPGVPPLKGTNIPGISEEITAIRFSPDLRRVRFVGTGTGEKFEYKAFDPEVFRELSAQRGSVQAPVRKARRAEWVLRPFWERA